MNLKTIFLFLVFAFLGACSNAPVPETKTTQALPKSQSKVAWKQNDLARTTQTVTATLEDNNTISLKIQAVVEEVLSFNDIPYEVGVHPIGYSLNEKGDSLVGATFSINQEATNCMYVAIKDEEKENNHFAITYVDTSRGIVSGKFKMKVGTGADSDCTDKTPDTFAFTSGEFAVKIVE